MIGLLYLKEEHVESIRSALARYLHQNREAILDRLWKFKDNKFKSAELQSPSKKQEGGVVPLLGEKNEGKQDIDIGDVDNLIELFYNIDVFQVKFDKDIQKYEKENPRRRHSNFDLELINYHEQFEPLVFEPEHHLGGENEGDQKNKNNKIRAASLVDQEELHKIFNELLE